MTTTQTTSVLTASDIEKIARLAYLQITAEQGQHYAADLSNILGLMDHLKTVDTEGVAPLKSPFDTAQPLRCDVVTEPNRRDAYQAIAPAAQDGLYLVPKVLD